MEKMLKSCNWKEEITLSTEGNIKLINWIEEVIELCQCSDVYLCDGSDEEYTTLCNQMVAKGMLKQLNPSLRPNSYLACSDPQDVSRVEGRTFICSEKKEDAGPTNNWSDPTEMKQKLLSLFSACMTGRRLYIIPFSMGPVGSDIAHIGVQLTDSPYVAASMGIMTRVGHDVLKQLKTGFFVPCLHSVGVPLKDGQQDSHWPCDPDNRYIVHFPEEKSVWSYGSGYGGNALLGKKCFALRIASCMAREQGWLAEHMLILGLTSPEGEKKYIAAAFPSACGKTNLAMLEPTLPGWKVECVGDDIAWMKFKEDGKLYAVNPEAGFFGVAPGTSDQTNPTIMKTIDQHAVFTNVGLTKDGDVWWEGLTDKPPAGITTWKGKEFDPNSKEKAAHPNARFTVSASQSPCIDSKWEDPEGVPISAILFGGRRSDTIPLVLESLSWEHGVLLGAGVSSETTAAAVGEVGKLRHDPFAMLPFCGYNMGDYFQHWLSFSGKGYQLPKIFYVNWFRKDKGRWVWPGFGENCRVLKWVFQRIDDKVSAKETPVGRLPRLQDLDLTDLDISESDIEMLCSIDKDSYLAEIKEVKAYFSSLGNSVPEKLVAILEQIQAKIQT